MNKCEFCCTALEDVSVKKGENLILDHISLHLHCKEITAIIGPNGAGKTTLFKTILGEEYRSGAIHYVTHKGKDKHFSPIIGYVPQHLHFDRLTPISVLDLFASCINKKPAFFKTRTKFREDVEKALAQVNLEYVMDRSIGALSGGELQRVMLALALMPVPDILLLDEPISGVDLKGEQRFYELVKGLRDQYHMAIVLISHDLPLLPEVADKVILLNQKVICQGSPQEVLSHEMTKQLFHLV